MIAVVPARAGLLATGADAAVAAAHGRVLVVGEATADAALELAVTVRELWTCEAGAFAPAAWASSLAAALVAEPAIVLPASPDGRDLAPRLAAALGRPCFAGCTEVEPHAVVRTRHDGATSVTTAVEGPFVATLLARRVQAVDAHRSLPPARAVDIAASASASAGRDATVVGVDHVDPGELDLAEAARVVAGGVGLGGAPGFAALAELAGLLGASMGATRPVADLGVVGHDRQIGTTGESVDPALYVAFGISGAVQHTAALGHPDKVVAVNLDASCPMMAMADLAVVSDAAATVDALVARLRGEPR